MLSKNLWISTPLSKTEQFSCKRAVKDQDKEAIALQADSSDPAAVAQMFGRIDQVWGGMDNLINNAGTDGDRAFGWQADMAAWRNVIEVNLFGAFYCSRGSTEAHGAPEKRRRA